LSGAPHVALEAEESAQRADDQRDHDGGGAAASIHQVSDFLVPALVNQLHRVTTKAQCLPFHRTHEILVRRHFGPDISREAMQTPVWGRLPQVH
jgi:hypothetical protein